MRESQLHRSILRDFGYELQPDSRVLDFGCGDGKMVREYRCSGFQAFGVDVVRETDSEFVRLISPDTEYRIPFADETFDFVFSNSVLEHVDDLRSALAEIRRVLKPGGASLHIFPARVKPIEPHVHVPLAGLLRYRWWLLLWAFLGVRNPFQRKLAYRDVARRNYGYLHAHTFYRPKARLRQAIAEQFGNVTFAEKEMITHSYGLARRLSRPVKYFPIIAALYGSFHNRCVFFEKHRSASA